MKKVISLLFIVLIFFFYNLDLKSQRYKSKNQDIEKASNINITISNFENIKLGDSVENVLSKIGNPGRIDESEYSFKWYVYNQYGEKFAMVGIEDNKVVALYSNSINSFESENITLKESKNSIRGKYTTLEYKKKGNTKYIIDSKDQYDIINLNEKFITVFYDIYKDNRVCSYQIIDEKNEKNLKGIYPQGSEKLKESFELEIIDLVNSTRLRENLNVLKYSSKAKKSSRSHSKDMIEKNFFDHVNKDNKTPFDRMKEEGIEYTSAGENIAAGQTSAIYVHEAWMNSKGHRDNILGDYNYIGVGVNFGGYYNIYYTQNFYK